MGLTFPFENISTFGWGNYQYFISLFVIENGDDIYKIKMSY